MTQNKLKCESCGELTPKEWTLELNGKVMCEDCYIDKQQKQTLKACDPFAVQSAKMVRKLYGQVGTEGLTELQKRICEFIQKNGKATADQLRSEFDLTSQQLEKEVAILRHCELVRAKKIDGQVYIVPF